MNILILSDIETAGEWIVTQTLIEKLRKKGEYKFYLLAYGKNKVHLDESLFKKIVFINKAPLIPPFRYYRQIILDFINSLEKLKLIKNIVKDIDVVLATNEYLLFIASFLTFPFAKKIFCLQGIRNTKEFAPKSFNLYYAILRFLERFAWFISTKLVVPSNKAKRTVEEEIGFFSKIKKINLIPNIVADFFLNTYSLQEINKFKKNCNIPLKDKIIVYSGRIDIIKGLDHLLKGFILLRKRLKKVSLIIAYPDVRIDKKLLARLIKIAKDDQATKSVYFNKNIPRQKLPLLYQGSDCAIFPSYLEMDSLSLKESLTSGLPVFSTDTGSAKELLKNMDKLFILKNNSAKEISNSLAKFFAQNKLWHAKVKKEVVDFTQDELTNSKFIKEYEKILH